MSIDPALLCDDFLLERYDLSSDGSDSSFLSLNELTGDYTWFDDLELSDDDFMGSKGVVPELDGVGFDEVRLHAVSVFESIPTNMISSTYKSSPTPQPPPPVSLSPSPPTYPPSNFNNGKITRKANHRKFFIKISYDKQILISKIKHQLPTFLDILSDYKPTTLKAKAYNMNHHRTKFNLYELSCKLNLSQYDVKVTKRIELEILEIFIKYCGFEFGKTTWLKSTTKRERMCQIEFLFLIFNDILPITEESLETIITRGCYRGVQYQHKRIQRKSQK